MRRSTRQPRGAQSARRSRSGSPARPMKGTKVQNPLRRGRATCHIRASTPRVLHFKGGFLVARNPPISASCGESLCRRREPDHFSFVTRIRTTALWRNGSTPASACVQSDPHPHRVRAFPNAQPCLHAPSDNM